MQFTNFRLARVVLPCATGDRTASCELLPGGIPPSTRILDKSEFLVWNTHHAHLHASHAPRLVISNLLFECLIEHTLTIIIYTS